MIKLILLNHSASPFSIIENEKLLFLRSLLVSSQIPIPFWSLPNQRVPNAPAPSSPATSGSSGDAVRQGVSPDHEEKSKAFLRASEPAQAGSDAILGVDGKRKLRNLLLQQGFRIEDHGNAQDIYLQNILIGKFLEPLFTLKRDFEKEISKQIYLEVRIETRSVFE